MKTSQPSLVFPAHALVGSLGDLARTLAQGTEVPEEFYFASALTTLGALCGTDLTLNVGIEVEPRLYTVLLGESYDVKKSTALRQTLALFQGRCAAHGLQICYGVGSAEGLARELEASATLLLAYDELSTFVEKSKVQGSVLMPMAASLFEGHHWDNATKHAQRSISVRDARLSMLACCTTETYSRIWSREAIAIGLPNRLFVVSAERKRRVAWPEKPDGGALQPIERQVDAQLSRLPLRLGISDEAKCRWEHWYATLPGSEHTKRLDTIGFRLLPLVALTTDKGKVDLETVEIVLAILAYELRVRILTDPIDADNTIAAMEERVRRTLTTHGALSKRELQRKVHANRFGLWAWEKSIDNLKGAKEIGWNGREYYLLASTA